jgi:hypothetical protein
LCRQKCDSSMSRQQRARRDANAHRLFRQSPSAAKRRQPASRPPFFDNPNTVGPPRRAGPEPHLQPARRLEVPSGRRDLLGPLPRRAAKAPRNIASWPPAPEPVPATQLSSATRPFSGFRGGNRLAIFSRCPWFSRGRTRSRQRSEMQNSEELCHVPGPVRPAFAVLSLTAAAQK